MIAAGYNDGHAIIYKKDSQIVAQTLIKCYVDSKDGNEYGAFEIMIEDKNDYKDIKSKIERWYTKIKEALLFVSGEIKVISEAVELYMEHYYIQMALLL